MTHPIRYAVCLFSCVVLSPAAGHDCWGNHHGEDACNYDHHSSRYAAPPLARVAPSYATPAQKVVDGKVSEIIYLPGANPESAMVEIRLDSAAGAALVQLAPVGLLKQNQLILRQGDAISITGFAVSGMDGDLLVATEVRKGDQRLALRDTRGRPAW